MKEMSLKDIQSISLDILKDIHTFCTDNGIHYSLSGGTLLGAVRHKGFIPWDDDVDLMMPRADYNRFCKIYKSERFNLVSLHNDKSCMVTYARVCDMTLSYVDHQTWTKQKVGVWVDIFPFDGAENTFELFEKDYQSITRIWLSSFRYRALNEGPKSSNTTKLNMVISLAFFFHIRPLIQRYGRLKLLFMDKRAQRIPYGSTDYVSQYGFCKPGTKEYHKYELFSTLIELPFEDVCASAISGYHQYLENLYGDYMTLPPEDQRYPKQDYLTFYWKD